ncbi:MAG: peptide ABC transporter substrate-binding protein [Thermomicrobiales bacterium]
MVHARSSLGRLYDALKTGEIDRRSFIQGTAAAGASLGLATFLANTATAAPGSLKNGAAFYAQDATPEGTPVASPVSTSARPTGGTENQTRGEGGELKLLLWQAPTILNPHNATGVKDYIAGSLVLEPPIHYLPDASMTPNLITQIPSVENGQLAEDLTSVTFTFLPGILWSDGEPFTVDDLVFTWQWNIEPTNESQNITTWQTIKNIEAVDATTAKVTFSQSNPFWFDAFAGTSTAFVLPKHILDGGDKEGNDAFGLKPIGTGPFQVDSFSPNDQVLYSANPNYREPNKPFYASVNLKGGGDAASAARAVLQTGEVDYAWNLQVEPEVLQGLISDSAPGQVLHKPGAAVERININFSDPNKEVDGQRSEMNTPHPFFTDPKVREAFGAAIDRQQIAEKFYGEGSPAVANLVTGVPETESPNTSWEYNADKANQILDEAGWAKDGDTRKKDGVELKVVYATSVNQVRQKTQAVVKKNLEAIGVKVELVQVDAGIYFDSAAGNDQTVNHFYWDIDMYQSVPNSPRPISFMEGWYAGKDGSNIAQKSNGWSGQNTGRYNNPDYDAAFVQAQSEVDAEKLAQLFIAMNDFVVNDVAIISLVRVSQNEGASKKLNAENIAPAAFSYDTWNAANWRTV